jgi:signal transduction histidine kinase
VKKVFMPIVIGLIGLSCVLPALGKRTNKSEKPKSEAVADEIPAQSELRGASPVVSEAPIIEEATDETVTVAPATTADKSELKKTKKRQDDFILGSGNVVADFNEQSFSDKRRVVAQGLVEKAAAFFKKNDLATSFNAFTYSKDFIKGELYVFAYDMDGTCLAIGAQRDMLWQNLYDYKDSFGSYVVRSIIETAKKGGGWLVYEWRNTTKVSYIFPVEKDGKKYALGCGFYPHSKRDAVINLVNGAVSHFTDVMERGGNVSEAFSRFNYSLGDFVFGDLYIFGLDFDGKIMAQGDRPGLIGQNALEHKDATGKYENKEIIEKLKTSPGGVWVDYTSKRAKKSTYARKVTDKQGKNYFIACGYYPEADRRAVVDLVRKGYKYVEGHGISQAVEEFSSKANVDFRYGDLYLFMYDLTGKVVAYGDNPDLIGINQNELTDDNGVYYVQAIIEKAKAGGGWIDYMENNSPRFVYVEQVEIGNTKLAIGSGLHPISKPEMMQLLVKRAVSSLSDVSLEQALGQIVKRGGDFVKGDLDIFVFDFKGICYAYGEDASRIWKNMYRELDEKGIPFVEQFIKVSQDGSGIFEYTMNNAKKVAYLESLEKDGVHYVVGSSFYKDL